MKRLRNILGREVDNSPLILFRIFFGLLMVFESIGAILTGWAKETFADPAFTFNFIGLDFLQVLAGPQIYCVYTVLALLGAAIALGWHYRVAAVLFTLLWGAVYLLQKTHYNNHHYLVWLISMFLAVVPAHRYRSVFTRVRPHESRLTCPYWCILIFQLQIAIVYFYAAIAKVYPDWLLARPIGIFLSAKDFQTLLWNEEFASALREFFSKRSVHYFISYAGIFFDLLVVPAFLFRRTRTLALIASLVFHLSNSLLFQIGVFPYFALSFAVFFYPRETIRRIFFRGKEKVDESLRVFSKLPRWSFIILLYFMVQLWLPLRHWRIPGDVLWTEEGHRLSWRMMLRSRSGYATVRVVNEGAGIDQRVNLREYLTMDQISDMATKPDMLWQFARIVEKDYVRTRGVDDVEVYINARAGVNGRKLMPLTDPGVDLTAVRWKRFGHQDWILPSPF